MPSGNCCSSHQSCMSTHFTLGLVVAGQGMDVNVPVTFSCATNERPSDSKCFVTLQ